MDLEEFEGLIDDYQLAQESGKYKARVDARIALKDAWRGLEAERDALRKDAERFRFLWDEIGELIWYPPRWNGNPKARFDLYWECEEKDLRKAIDDWRVAIAAKEPK